MEGFTSNFHSRKPSYSFIDIDQSMEFLNQFSVQYDNPNLNSQSLMGFSNDNFLYQQVLPPFDHQFVQSFQPVSQYEKKNIMVIHEPVATGPTISGKRKSMDVSASSSGNSSSHPVPENEINNEKKYQVYKNCSFHCSNLTYFACDKRRKNDIVYLQQKDHMHGN